MSAQSTDGGSEPNADSELRRVKNPRTEKQEIVADAIEEYAVIMSGGQIDVNPVVSHLQDVHGKDYTTKAYVWQIVGEFFALEITSEHDPKDLYEARMEGYREGVKDMQGDMS